jgi:hypothetical protein
MLALSGLLDPACACTSSPNYILNIGGLIIAIVFTYVFVFLSTRIPREEPIISTAD